MDDSKEKEYSSSTHFIDDWGVIINVEHFCGKKESIECNNQPPKKLMSLTPSTAAFLSGKVSKESSDFL